MKSAILAIFALLLTGCALNAPLPPGTTLNVGGKNPVSVDASGLTWKQALKKAGQIVFPVLLKIGSNYAANQLESRLFPGSTK